MLIPILLFVASGGPVRRALAQQALNFEALAVKGDIPSVCKLCSNQRELYEMIRLTQKKPGIQPPRSGKPHIGF